MVKKIIPFNVAIKSTATRRSYDIPKAYTNDLNSVEFQFTITDLSAEELSTATANVLLYMRDGSFFQNTSLTGVTIDGTVVKYTMKENEGNHSGIGETQVEIFFDEAVDKKLASQKYEFEIVSGLETEVAVEVMIQDWTTLTRDAQDYIDTFAANEVTRQQQFSDAQTQRTTDFGTAQTSRAETFEASEQSRTDAFGLAESARSEGYTADHGRAETDHTTAAADHTTAGTDHTTAAADHTLAASDHTTAAADHTIVQGYNTRLTAEETATANNKISTAKAKTFADVDARFEELETQAITVDARTEFDALNLSNGGDFAADSNADGVADYWSKMGPVAVSYDSVEKAQSFNSAYTNVGLENIVKQQIVLNHKYAHVFKLKKTTSEASVLRVGLGASTSNILLNMASVADSEYTTESYTQIVKVVTVSTLPVNYASSALFSGNNGTNCNAKIKDYLLVNLTETFGAGKEPTQDEFKRLMARFPNSWFDGVKPIQTIETLYQEKANKVQEAWITPTLTNGWVADTGYTVGYMKDEMGFIHIKGRVKNGTLSVGCFTLPVGYRTLQNQSFSVLSNGVIVYIQVLSNGTVYIPSIANNTYVHLDNIAFRAEA